MKHRLVVLVLCAALALAAGCTTATPEATEAAPAEATPTPCGEKLSPVAAAASSETAFTAANVLDGLHRTQWLAVGTDTEWISVDLGDVYHITRVIIYWEPDFEGPRQTPNYATHYELQVSDDGESWTTVRNTVDADGGADDFTGLDATGRYVRMYATAVSNHSGSGDRYEIWEIEVFGEAAAE